MRRLPYLLSLVPLALSACDPDLTVAPKGGADAAAEVGVDPGPGPVTPDEDGGGGEAGTNDDGGVEDDSGGPGTTHTIDGDNDFDESKEKFLTSSTAQGAYEAFIAWDSKNLYVGMRSAGDGDIGSGAGPKKWVLIYLDGPTATQTGVKYADGAVAGQQPQLPFAAGYHVGLKTDLSFTNKLKWDGGNWVDAGFSFIPVAKRKPGFLEVAIPLSALGNPTKVKLHISMINEAAGSEWTYASVPSTSITDGPDPDYGKYFEFDLADASKAPNTYTPK